MIEFYKATADDIERLMNSRLEMLRIVNNLPPDYEFDNVLAEKSREYFLNGNHSTVLAMDGERVIGCATLCYIELMPTFAHKTGSRAHLMNVYTNSNYRRQGIGARLVNMLIDEAESKGVTEISLDATQLGKPLYSKLGFEESDAYMALGLPRKK